MHLYLLIVISIVLAYLTGSIPSSVWIGRFFHGIDVREHGSFNAGATNTMRVLGLKTGIPVLIFDIFKGWLAVKYAVIFGIFPESPMAFVQLSIALGIVAIIGHIYPIWAGFKGGKGVATVFGVLLALHPLATLCAAATFLLILFLTKYVSLGSVIAGISFPIWIIFVFSSGNLYLNLFSCLVAVLIIVTHKKNLQRLFQGEEKKATFLFKRER